MILHGPGMRKSTEPYFYDAVRIMETVAAESQWNANEFLIGSSGPLATISPLLLHWAYRAAYMYEILCQDPNSGLALSSATFRLKLNTISRRWLAAGKIYSETTKAGADLLQRILSSFVGRHNKDCKRQIGFPGPFQPSLTAKMATSNSTFDRTPFPGVVSLFPPKLSRPECHWIISLNRRVWFSSPRDSDPLLLSIQFCSATHEICLQLGVCLLQ